MLIDNINLKIKAGNGGDGAATLKRNAQAAKGGPDGGNGGNGGHIYFQGSSNITDLREFRYKKVIKALDGIFGKKNNMHGKNAPHITVLVPFGTRITDLGSGRVIEIEENTEKILLAQGGRGGRGNNELKSSTNRTPRTSEKGEPGEEKNLLLELRIIAQIGLIGMPNAGKSSLLASLTNARPEIANYQFTTTEPNIGMMGKIAIADVPGLIEGASQGRGLGVRFLKHIEKTHVLLHVLDSSAENVEKNYNLIRKELEDYSSLLMEKKEIIVLNKVDLVAVEALNKWTKFFEKENKHVFPTSMLHSESIKKLRIFLEKLLS